MLNIGEVARECGVTVEALRFYEREDLLPAPDRDTNGYRRYAPDAVRRVRFIKRAQEVGFTLGDIRDLLSLQTDPGASCADVRERAGARVREMEDKIAVLARMKAVLEGWIDECRGEGPVSRCPILDALDGDMERNGEDRHARG